MAWRNAHIERVANGYLLREVTDYDRLDLDEELIYVFNKFEDMAEFLKAAYEGEVSPRANAARK